MDKNAEFTKKLFDIINRLKRALVNPTYHSNDIRPSEEMFLIKINMLSNGSNVKVNDLVNMLKLAPSTVSTILKSLEDKGYITREVNKDNRREVFVKLTSAGNMRLEDAYEYHFNMVSELISYLGEEDASKFVEIFERTTLFFEMKKNERENKNEKNN